MNPLAIRASYADLKLVKTRQVAQLIFEVPIEDFDAAYEVLGGLPNPAKEQWFAIAALVAAPATTFRSVANVIVSGEKRSGGDDDQRVTAARPEPKQDRPARAKPGVRPWRDMQPQTQAGIRCNDPEFIAFLREERPDDWHESMENAEECVRLICGVASRRDLATDHRARVIWHQLDELFLTRKALERAS